MRCVRRNGRILWNRSRSIRETLEHRLQVGAKNIEIYTVEIGRRSILEDGPDFGKEIFTPWIELQLFDDVTNTDKWMSQDDPTTTVWPLSGEWTRSSSNRRVTLRRRDGGARLARLYYNSWPWHKGDEGVAELDETFDGTKKAVYVIKEVS